jgi:hypothetical protein
MEFPNEIKQHILSYLPHPYKKPFHLDAINKTPMFADLTIDREMTLELEKELDDEISFLWMNSYIEYKKHRHEMIF